MGYLASDVATQDWASATTAASMARCGTSRLRPDSCAGAVSARPDSSRASDVTWVSMARGRRAAWPEQSGSRRSAACWMPGSRRPRRCGWVWTVRRAPNPAAIRGASWRIARGVRRGAASCLASVARAGEPRASALLCAGCSQGASGPPWPLWPAAAEHPPLAAARTTHCPPSLSLIHI